MSDERASSANQARTLALLWGSHTKPGRSGLTLRAIIAVAIEIADEAGLEAVTMRRVADRLNVGTMSLYTHVPGKIELTELMVDAAYGQLYDDVATPSARPGGWREALAFIAARNWDLYQKHPWILRIVTARPGLGPNAVLKYEAELRPLDRIGLSDVEMDSVLSLILSHVEGTARAQANLDQVHRETGLSDAEWWVTTEPLLDKIMDGARFPVASRVGEATGNEHQAAFNPSHALSFGLARILDGVAALVAERTSPSPPGGSTAPDGRQDQQDRPVPTTGASPQP